MPGNLLTIVIPAYKSAYLEQTLESLSRQTRKDFDVVIGDDCSPANLEQIVNGFKDRLNIKYKRFDENLGATSLPKHWDRCVDLAEDSEWIWLFSDDDLVDENCVMEFGRALEQTRGAFDLYRFQTRIIDKDGGSKDIVSQHPETESAIDFLERRLRSQTISFVVEYIFRLKKYRSKTGFVDFPLAWCSDDASWVLFAETTGIFTINGPKVSWRYSGENITSLYGSSRFEKRVASRQYLLWIRDWLDKQKLKVEPELLLQWYIRQMEVIGLKGRKQFLFNDLKWISSSLPIPLLKTVRIYLKNT